MLVLSSFLLSTDWLSKNPWQSLHCSQEICPSGSLPIFVSLGTPERFRGAIGSGGRKKERTCFLGLSLNFFAVEGTLKQQPTEDIWHPCSCSDVKLTVPWEVLVLDDAALLSKSFWDSSDEDFARISLCRFEPNGLVVGGWCWCLTRWPVSVWQSIYSEQKIILGYAWTLTLHNFATLAPPTIYCNIYEYTYSHAILLDLCSSVFLVGWHFACWESGGHIMEVLSWQFLILDET